MVETVGEQEGNTSGIRRRTVLASALGAVPALMATRTAGAAPRHPTTPAPGHRHGTELLVEHRVAPLGIDATAPRFNWRMASTERGAHQSAYQVLVATSPERLTPAEADMWNSGRISGPDSVAVRYDGAPLQPGTRYHCAVWLWDAEGRRVPDPPSTSFETGLLSTDGEAGWDGARWIGMAGKQPGSPGAPMLRREVRLTGEGVRRARLYVSALGVYVAYLGGERVGVGTGADSTYELLTPGWTNYEQTINYFTYDVTDHVRGRRTVTLAAVLGNGWYSSRISENSRYYSPEGNPLALKAKLVVTYADGSTQTVVTEPGAGWKATDTGPYRADDIYDGQTYDARRELPGWTDTGFDDSAWADVVEDDFAERFPDSALVAYPGESARFIDAWDLSPRSIVVYDDVAGEEGSPNGHGHIVVDPSRSVNDPDKAATASVVLGPKDTAIFDLGQNMVGVARFTVTGPAGAQVRLEFGEMLNDDSAGADGPAGSVYRANLRSAKATCTYTLRGTRRGETHEDTLTFYGFRYVSVTVTTPGGKVTIKDLTGRVATSAFREIGDITTNDELVNRLFRNARWGHRGNYLWIPTDCPQRDERLGWTGDTQVFAATGLYNSDAVNFLSHFQDTLIESQRAYGADGREFPCVAPGGKLAGAQGVSGWADCGVVVPWTVWQMSGDASIIDRSWDAMTRYFDWIRERTGDTYAGPGAVFADWLAFQQTSRQLMSDVYYAYSTRLMAEMAHATGRSAEAASYERLFERIKRAFIDKYLDTDADGNAVVRSSLGDAPGIPGDGSGEPEDNSQTALLWVLKLGLHDTDEQRAQLLDALVANIGNSPEYKEAHPGSTRVDYAENTLAVGFLGINVLADVLTVNGHAGLAYTLLHQDAMPSWLYSVHNGATTIWERWNSYSTEDGFGPVSMNSFNHYAYGAIVEWMYEHLAGIARDPEAPGFRHFFLQPKLDPTGKVTEVSGSHTCPHGTIVSEWSVSGSTFRYRVEIPANTTATLRVPTTSPSSVRTGDARLTEVDGVRFVGFSDGVASYELPSGHYELTSTVG